MKKWYQSKTMWLNIVLATTGAGVLYLPMLETVLPNNAFAILLFSSNAINMVLRKVTTEAIK